jgi:N-acetylglucosaminyldiphosphoundecaprenol N-acetyl-beta-D-mannosaminyltransferase
MMNAAKCTVGQINFTVVTLDQAVDVLLNEANTLQTPARPSGVAVHFANAFNVALASKDETYANLLNRADYVFSDGVPITWVGKRAYPQHAHMWERVYGPDVMTMVFQQSNGTEPRHYLLGSTPEVLATLTDQLQQRFPQALIVGGESPPFEVPTPQQLAERDQRIKDSGATMVWVGLGTPKQDWEVERIAQNLPVVALAVGAAFDFLAGTTKQAPRWMQRNGLEWLFRFTSEPKRLGRRYLWGNSVFAREALQTIRDSK